MFEPEHPRPQLFRPTWSSLDGSWDYVADADHDHDQPDSIDWRRARQIAVPYAPETLASRINDMTPCRDHWYRRTIAVPEAFHAEGNHRLVAHFGAVDNEARVFVDGRLVTEHEGGYLPFTVDLTRAAVAALIDRAPIGDTETDTDADGGGGDGDAAAPAEIELVVHASDDPFALDQPRGKQHWGPMYPWGIFYHRTSGIWQTVWLEVIPAVAIDDVVWTSTLDPLEVHFEISLDRPLDHATVDVTLSLDGNELAATQVEFVGLTAKGTISLEAVDMEGDDLVWSIDKPILIDADISLRASGDEIDRVGSYLGIRLFEAREGRFYLNGTEIFLRMVMDQGYWTHTGLTPPSPAALKRDVELAKSMGFNTVRKHQKLEDPRYLAWADKLGLLVWCDLPSCFVFSSRAMLRTTNLLAGAIVRDRSHPSVITWSPINSSWGVPELEDDARQRAFVRTLCELARSLDGTRPIPANDGLQAVGGNIHGIHDYEGDLGVLARRWAGPNAPRTIGGQHRTSITAPVGGSPVVLSGFGGLAIAAQNVLGYRFVDDAAAYDTALMDLLDTVRSSPVLAGFCYTQLTDVYHEATGLATMDRTTKIPVDRIREIVTGPKREELPVDEPPRLRLVRPNQ